MSTNSSRGLSLRICGNIAFFMCIVCSTIFIGDSHAAEVKLLPTTPIANLLNGNVVTLNVVVDFSDTGGPLGGGFDVTFRSTDLYNTLRVYDFSTGEAAFNDLPSLDPGAGTLNGWAIGNYTYRLPDTVVLGSLSFRIEPAMGLRTTIATRAPTGFIGPWISGADYLSVIEPTYQHVVITRTSCGDAVLDHGETCDDGNANSSDGCSTTCLIERGYDCTLPIPGNPPTPSVCSQDTDGDAIFDAFDNCTLVSNATQLDTDDDDIGNICDPDVAIPNDCFVNFLDLNVYKANFFQAGDLDTDNNGDGQTNFADLNILKSYFFGPPGPSVDGCN